MFWTLGNLGQRCAWWDHIGSCNPLWPNPFHQSLQLEPLQLLEGIRFQVFAMGFLDRWAMPNTLGSRSVDPASWIRLLPLRITCLLLPAGFSLFPKTKDWLYRIYFLRSLYGLPWWAFLSMILVLFWMHPLHPKVNQSHMQEWSFWQHTTRFLKINHAP